MLLLVVRHGQTEHNVQGIIQGQLDTQLNDYGRFEAHLLSERLQDIRITEAWSSPLSRAAETASIVLRHHPEVKLRTHDGIKERGLGSMEGRTRGKGERAPADAEPETALRARTVKWFDAFLEAHRPTSSHPSLPRQHRPSHPTGSGRTSHHVTSSEQSARIPFAAQISRNIPGLSSDHGRSRHEHLRSDEQVSSSSRSSDTRIVMVVSHGAWISRFFQLLYSAPYNFTLNRHVDPRQSCYNTSIMAVTLKYDVVEGKWNGCIESWADVEHLRGHWEQEVKEVTDDLKS
ncbi:hypothetical protein IAU60_001275 [Kwoniella sp. DSM 27419]